MKTILMSIQPEYVQDILNEIKTRELRKTIPTCELPCRVFIYCTKKGRPLVYASEQYGPGMFRDVYTRTYGYGKDEADRIWGNLQGKVIAEFTLNKYDKYEYDETIGYNIPIEERTKLCLGEESISHYGAGKTLYSLHIDNLIIRDGFLEESYLLEDFIVPATFESNDFGYFDGKTFTYWNRVKKAPQSWMYVEKELDYHTVPVA